MHEALSRKVRQEGDRLSHWCPACCRAHSFRVGPNMWMWNGSLADMTVTPSIKHTFPRREPKPEMTCHYYITHGQLIYQADCTHALAGKTVELPDWPEANR